MPSVSKKELDRFIKNNPDTPATLAIVAQLENSSGTGNKIESPPSKTGGITEIFDSAENLKVDEAAAKVNMLQDKILQGCIDIVEYSIELGQTLYNQKNTLKHGQWLNWTDKSIALGYTQISHYLRIYIKHDEIRQKMGEIREQGLKPSFRKMITAITKKDTKKLEEFNADYQKAQEAQKQKENNKQTNISMARQKEIALIAEMYNHKMIDANGAKAMQDRWNIYNPKDQFTFYDLFEANEFGSRVTVDVTFEVDRELWIQYHTRMERPAEEFTEVLNNYVRNEINKCQEARDRANDFKKQEIKIVS